MPKGRIIAAAVLIFITVTSFAVIAIRNNMTMTNKTARIYQNGELIREIALDDISEPIEFDISDDDGHTNTIRAEQGRICMLRADCPDKVCVEQGWIDNGVLPIVCLPNKVTIEITGGESDVDISNGGI